MKILKKSKILDNYKVIYIDLIFTDSEIIVKPNHLILVKNDAINWEKNLKKSFDYKSRFKIIFKKTKKILIYRLQGYIFSNVF